MDKANKFREILAEQGMETTPEEAERLFRMASKIRKFARRLSTKDLWDLEDNDGLGMSREERLQIAELYRTAKDI